MSLLAPSPRHAPEDENEDDAIASQLREHGFARPLPFLSPTECDALAECLRRSDRPAPLDWPKGRAASDRVLYEIGAAPRLIALLQPLLGDDIILWGANVTVRRPGARHPWHTDMEATGADGRLISVWLGLQNVSRQSGLKFLAGSHRFGRSVQQVAAEWKEKRANLTDAWIAEAARQIDPSARIIQPDVSNGQILLFDSLVWHAGINEDASGARTSLLLQYAAAGTTVPMPRTDGYEWPFRFVARPRVPMILVSGRDHCRVNRLVPPPPLSKEVPMITTLTRHVAMPLAEDPVKRWRSYQQFRGPTRTFASMSCHISVLSSGHHPHPPHVHPEEEILVVLDGEVDIELADSPAGGRRLRLVPGMFSYYPATQHHTLHNVGAKPATYLMFKWRAGLAGVGEPLPASVFEYDLGGLTTNARGETRPMMTKVLFQQPTHCLGKLHAHLTTLLPGGGYDPHVDAYDVAILLLSGEVETLGERVRPFGIIYYSAGELHGMRNAGTVPAVYLVFEFHSPAALELKEAAREKTRHDRATKKQREAERQRRKLEKQRRKRGPLGLARRAIKAVRRLVRGRRRRTP